MSAGPPPGEVRIIGGQYKRSKLPVLSVAGLRPTPDRVRETLFNWLGQDLSGWRCLDAFAGTGALGFECASRGAAQVMLVEDQAQLVASLSTQAARLGCESIVSIRRGDGLSVLSQFSAAFELVLLDPPFDATWAAQALPKAVKAVVVGGYIYHESPKLLGADEASALGLSVHRHLKAGQVHAHLLIRTA